LCSEIKVLKKEELMKWLEVKFFGVIINGRTIEGIGFYIERRIVFDGIFIKQK
jgi:hypothetical protein